MNTTISSDQSSIVVGKIWECIDIVDNLTKMLKPVSVNTPEGIWTEVDNHWSTPVLQIIETLCNGLKRLNNSIII